ncbi:carbamate kinase (plasmid) [Clostridium botulinum]|uniref:Carbamate kinase n=1 Tax=Clostridium botulinum C/D str. DC5 TaxID=1443128 RepID=A0A0A0IH67_CLOBO|nr:carbamate kinase [Clostridium botulinum]KGM92974.1 carbamate kinase [Clostridium botulinum D str. CCUG 7971]KGM98910.1 carbamate kinase [Clostridium botulinum C/D str. DC5]KOC50125.1 carbamate kinase [Clostridium botulinum]KOC50939.1 carbamate kinase [Clostridium botulinum]KOC57242.1 carbamate kinase [Clostridium botulinum]
MKIVLALGGNALQANPKDASAESQLITCKKTAKSIVDLIEEGHTVAIVHGNGPQVGQILSSIEGGHKFNSEVNKLMPFDVCGAYSQGYIGYHLQNAIEGELRKRNIKKPVDTVITQVLVDKNDEGFQNPTKPIGSFYSKEEAKKLSNENGYIMKEDAGRGYRRVVASPKPLDIVEKDTIKAMLSAGIVTISCGGGGVPVIEEKGEMKGVPAVIDKDFAAEKLAEIINADMLLILTAVDRVCINFNKPNEKELKEITLEEVDKYIKEGQFAPGSMLPKVEAAKKFVEFVENKIVLIDSFENVKAVIKVLNGTRIVNS